MAERVALQVELLPSRELEESCSYNSSEEQLLALAPPSTGKNLLLP